MLTCIVFKTTSSDLVKNKYELLRLHVIESLVVLPKNFALSDKFRDFLKRRNNFFRQASVKYRVRHELDVPMEIPKEVEEVTATVTDPDQRSVSSTFRPEADGLHHLRFTPYKPGSYTVDIRSRGKSVEGSPFTMSVVDPASTLVRMREPDQATEAR